MCYVNVYGFSQAIYSKNWTLFRIWRPVLCNFVLLLLAGVDDTGRFRIRISEVLHKSKQSFVQLVHVSHRFSDFFMAFSFFSSNNCSRSVLAKNWRLCMQLATSACKVCMRLAASRMQILPEWPPLACKLYPSGRQTHATWIKSAEIFLATGGHTGIICMRLAATGVQFACDWRPLLGYKTRDKQTRGVQKAAFTL